MAARKRLHDSPDKEDCWFFGITYEAQKKQYIKQFGMHRAKFVTDPKLLAAFLKEQHAALVGHELTRKRKTPHQLEMARQAAADKREYEQRVADTKEQAQQDQAAAAAALAGEQAHIEGLVGEVGELAAELEDLVKEEGQLANSPKVHKQFTELEAKVNKLRLARESVGNDAAHANLLQQAADALSAARAVRELAVKTYGPRGLREEWVLKCTSPADKPLLSLAPTPRSTASARSGTGGGEYTFKTPALREKAQKRQAVSCEKMHTKMLKTSQQGEVPATPAEEDPLPGVAYEDVMARKREAEAELVLCNRAIRVRHHAAIGNKLSAAADAAPGNPGGTAPAATPVKVTALPFACTGTNVLTEKATGGEWQSGSGGAFTFTVAAPERSPVKGRVSMGTARVLGAIMSASAAAAVRKELIPGAGTQ